MNENVKSDVSQFLYRMAAHYFSTSRALIYKYFEGLHRDWHPLYVGANVQGFWNVPPPREVLQAAAQYTDFLFVVSEPMQPDRLGFYERYYGKPLVAVNYKVANADSALWMHPARSGVFNYPTQEARGQAYYDNMATSLKAKYPL
jgi:hypothetical protein